MAFEVTLVPKENIELGVTTKAVFTLSNVTPTIPVPGPKGDKGDTGDTGPQGPQGEKGDKGDPGAAAGLKQGTATGTDTYSVSVFGVTSYVDGDVILVRFTNGNTTTPTLNVNTLGAKTLYRNNDGVLLGGDILANGELICIYNSSLNGFNCIGTSPNMLLAYVTNAQGSTITKGQPVYAFGAQGDRLTVKLAYNTGDATSSQTLGLVLSTSIGVNQKGLILVQGELDGLNLFPTSTWADGDAVYLGATAGTLTKTKPAAPNHLVYLGFVITASNGSAGRMYVRIQNGYEMNELHDVQSNGAVNKDILYRDTTVTPNLWKPASISTILGYTPEPAIASGTTAQYLRGDKNWATLDKSAVGLSNVDNTSDATKNSASATLTNKTISGANNTISNIAQSSVTNLTTDLAGKETTITAGTTAQYWRGDKSWQTLNNSAVGLGNVDNTSDANKPVSTATQTALNAKVDANSAIAGATKTKITFDSKGLVTAGADATTADIAASTNKNYITDAQLTVLGNTSGTNTGDETNATIKTKLGAASATQDGYLTSTNWSTFNGKQNALTNPVTGTGTTNELAYFTGSTTVASLTTATYPTLTELSRVKGVTSGIQSQLDSKQGTLTLTTTGTSGAATLVGNTLNIPQYAGTTYTFSTGLTNSGGTVTNNLSVGVAGGQSVIGASRASENLTLSSTSNATKGAIIFGTSEYDEANNRLGIQQLTPTSKIHLNHDQAGVTQSDANGILLANATAAALGTQAISPPLVLQSNGWGTTAAASQDVRFRMDVLPVQGTTATGRLQIASNIASGGYTNRLTLTSLGLATLSTSNTETSGTFQALNVTHSLTPASNSDISPRTVSASTQYNASGINFTNNVNLQGSLYAENRILNAGTITRLQGAYFQGCIIPASATASGNISTIVGFATQALSVFNNSITNTTTAAIGTYIYDSIKGNSTLSFQSGMTIEPLVCGTNNTSILLGQTNIPSGNWGIYNSSSYNNYFNGNLGLGTSSDGGFKLDVNGTTRLQNDVTISDTRNIILSTGTGTKIGTATGQKIGFWNKTPIAQPTTAVAAAAFVANTGTAVNDASTFGGYTIKQIVQALQNTGLLA